MGLGSSISRPIRITFLQSLFSKNPILPNSPTIEICTNCNTSFSRDEEYFAAFLGAVLIGSTEPEAQNTATAAGIFRHSKALRKRVDAQRQNYTTLLHGSSQRMSYHWFFQRWG